MIGRAGLALATLLLVCAAAAPAAWRWRLPDGWSAPPVPADNPMTPAKVALGRRLFYDADLSIDGTMSCATCHEQHRGFTDGNATHAGVHGEPGRRNAPGLANVAWRAPLTWADPRIRRLEDQVATPVSGIDPVEMGMAGHEAEIAARLKRDACYRALFRAGFPERRGRIDRIAIARALAAFERTLISADAPFDRGDVPAGGAALFKRDCAGCHSGHDFTDDRFHALRASSVTDRGLALITGRPEDIGAFRTPSLRNAAVTGPWLHDGSAKTLAAALAAHPGKRSDQEVTELVMFLDTLTDRAFLSDPAFSYPDRPCDGLRARQGDDR